MNLIEEGIEVWGTGQAVFIVLYFILRVDLSGISVIGGLRMGLSRACPLIP